MVLRATGDGVEVGARDFPTNRGGLCQRGWTAADLLDHPDRLTTPLLRDRPSGELRPATWDEAVDRIAAAAAPAVLTRAPVAPRTPFPSTLVTRDSA